MIKKEEVISFVWQHVLLLVSLYVMTFGVAACVRSQLGSSVISTIPYVMASAGKMLDYIPGWTIGGYTIMMNAIFVVLEVGLGGTLDSTNVIEKPACAVITALGMDHVKEVSSFSSANTHIDGSSDG